MILTLIISMCRSYNVNKQFQQIDETFTNQHWNCDKILVEKDIVSISYSDSQD